MTELSKTPLLDQIASPEDLRKLDKAQLPTLADELRRDLIDAVSQTGGHFGAGLGVIELTTAIHYVFNTPDDRVIWDVGHQAYPHKILTGRRNRMHTIRKGGGLSGFTKRSESAFDPFGAAHSSTSISSGLGMATARDLAGARNHVIAVIGDGATSAGMAYEAINNAGALGSKLIIVLNDNAMSIARPVGASSDYFARLAASKRHHELRVDVDSHVSERTSEARVRSEKHARGLLGGGNWFDEMGLLYLGPINGHDLRQLVPILEAVRDDEYLGPVLIHVLTEKGHGYAPAANSADKGHAVGKFDVATGAQVKAKASAPTYTKVFAEALIKEAEDDPKVVAITAAMPSGTGLDLFERRFPDRMFDVGIAEQHAVTFAAGLATEGFRPFCAIYSTFLQRAYDQVVHDVAIQKLPVRFAMDRAGLVGADGATHAGSFDLSYLCCLPGFVVMAAADEAELVHMVATAAAYDEGPIAFRYPRGEGTGVPLPERGKVLEIGKGRVLREGGDVAILSLGTRLAEAIAAANILEDDGISCTVADARFAKPIDEELIARLVRRHRLLVSVEEGAIGGFGAQVLSFVANGGLLRPGFEVRTMTLPDMFIDHDDMARQYDQAGLNAADIVNLIRRRVLTRAVAGA